MSKIQRYAEAKRRTHVYTACLIGMIACAIMAIAYAVSKKSIDDIFPNYVFWLEAIGLVSFGVSWLTASRTIPVITNPQERFHIIDGWAQEDQATQDVRN